MRALVVMTLWAAATAAQAHPGNAVRLHQLSHQIERAPTQEAYLRRAGAHLESGNLDAAEADILAASALGQPVDAAYHRALWLKAQGRTGDALVSVSAFLTRHPQARPALHLRAGLYREQGNPAAALQDYRRLLAAPARSNPGLYLEAARLAVELGVADHALDLLDQGMATLGMVVALQREAIAIALDRNDVNQALARQKALRSTMKNSPLWHLQLAELYWSAGRTGPARQTLANLLTNLDRLNPALQRRAQALDRKITATGSG